MVEIDGVRNAGVGEGRAGRRAKLIALRLGGDIVTDALLAAAVNLRKPPYYIHWGVIQLSAANAIVIALMTIVFVLALVTPFPKGRGRQ